MGLKTTNYDVKKLGITLPKAYAVVKNLRIDGESAVADFSIQATRENSFKLQPIETARVYFKVDRNENPYVTAYRVAKGSKEVQEFKPETGKMETVVKHEPFHGWEDDIVEGE